MTYTPEVLTLSGRLPSAARIRVWKVEPGEPGPYVSYPGLQTVENAAQEVIELQRDEEVYGNPENVTFQVLVGGEVVYQTHTREANIEEGVSLLENLYAPLPH